MSVAPTATAKLVGAEGARRRMMPTISSDQALSPASLYAWTEMRYVTSPVTSGIRWLVWPSGKRSLSTGSADPA